MVLGTSPAVSLLAEAQLQGPQRCSSKHTTTCPTGRGRRSPRPRPRRARLSTKRAQPRRLGCEDTTVPHTALFRRPHPPAGCDCPDPFTVPARPGGVASHSEARLQSSERHDAAQTHDNMPAGRGRRSPRPWPLCANLSKNTRLPAPARAVMGRGHVLASLSPGSPLPTRTSPPAHSPPIIPYTRPPATPWQRGGCGLVFYRGERAKSA